MRVLITGIGGFAGSHLAEFASESQGAEVVGLTRVTPTDWLAHKEIKRYDVDIRDKDRVSRVMRDVAPDVVFHLAGQAYIPQSENAAVQTFEANIQGTINVLESVKGLARPCRILIVSTGAVYGESVPGKPLPDEESPFRPDNPYTASKGAVDCIAQSYRRTLGVDVVIARPYNHTGPRQTPAYVCAAIAQQMADIKRGRQNDAVRLGNLSARRDFSDVRDVVRAYWMMSQAAADKEFIFNVASGNVHSIQEVFDLLRNISGADAEVEVDDSRVRENDPGVLAGSARRLRDTVGWKPEFPFGRTLKDLYEYYFES